MDYFNMNIPGNSHRAKAEAKKQEEKPKIQSVAKGRAKKRAPGKKLVDVFITEDLSSVKDYIISDILIPNIKDAISSVVGNGIDMILFGETRGRSRGSIYNNSRYGSRVSYESYSRGRVPAQQKSSRPNVVNYDEIIFETAGEAHQVLDYIRDYCALYGSVSILDLYEAAGLSSQIKHTDQKYGWTNLDNADVRHLRSGDWLLVLPKPVVLD